MILPLSFSKYNIFKQCPIRYLYQYVIKPDIKREINYSLVLGSLVHLFINLFYDKNYTKTDIRNLNKRTDYLEQLLTKCSYLSFNFKDKRYTVTDTNFDSDIITFIEKNEVVYWHAFKLFNKYIDNVHSRFIKYKPSHIFSEFTFNNIIKKDNHTICFYGSIDNIFVIDSKKIIYLSDTKTGKNYYDYYIEQLYFYYYNIFNYNFGMNVNIVNNSDSIENIEILNKRHVTYEYALQALIFMLGYNEFDYKKKELFSTDDKYNYFVNRLFKDITNNIIPIHKHKDIKLIYDKYKDSYKYKHTDDVDENNINYLCKFCDYKKNDICEYRIES